MIHGSMQLRLWPYSLPKRISDRWNAQWYAAKRYQRTAHRIGSSMKKRASWEDARFIQPQQLSQFSETLLTDSRL
jgi:hypothetical protein